MAGKPTYEELEQKVNALEHQAEKCKRVDKALQESDEKYRFMMEAMNDPVYICSSDNRISFTNAAMIRRIGCDATGELCYKGIHGLEKKCPWCTHDKSQKGEKYEDEIISPKNGRFYHVSSSPIFHDNGSISKMTIYRDITNLKQAKEALKESEERYRLLTESVADGVAIFQERNFEFANAAIASIFGYTKDQLAEIDPFTLFRDDHKKRFRDLAEKLEKGIAVESFQTPCIRSDSREIWVDMQCSVINWNDKPAVLFTVRDITESKLKEFALNNEIEQAHKENIKLRSSLKDRYRFGKIIGKSAPIQEVYEYILKASRSDDNVVIYGESGSGKELVAQAIHDMSNRHANNFITVNCGALPETLIESEFFGYKKGAFTGANLDMHGYLDLADGGTLFLDEVGELGVNMQVKLLRAIEGRGYTPLGCNQTINSDFRIIAATNKNLFDMTKAGSLREDFFYRMHVISVDIPPLRDRMEDIPLLSDYFLKLHGNGKKLKTLPGQILEILRGHDWPGNVRELENVLKRYLTLNRLEFPGKNMHQDINGCDVLCKTIHEEAERQFDTLEKVEQKYIYRALQENNWHRANAAKTLGISERTLYRKLKQFPDKMS